MSSSGPVPEMSLPKQIQAAIEALLGPSGKSDPALRLAVLKITRTSEGEIPPAQPGALELRELVRKIDACPWTVNDEDFSKLRQDVSTK